MSQDDNSLPIKGKKRLKAKLKELSTMPLTKEVDPNNKPAKSTAVEVNQRVVEVANLLSVGYTRSYILKYAEKWHVSDTSVDSYISKAWKYIKEINDLTMQDNLGMITNQLWDLYRDCRKNNDRGNAVKALNQLAKI